MRYVKLSIVTIFMFFTISAAAKQTITLSNGEWKPYLGENLPNGGVASHIITEAFATQKIEVNYKWYGESWKRAYKDATRGSKVIGSAIWSYKKEREKEVIYSEPVIPGADDVFFHMKGNKFNWTKPEDLKDVPIGGVQGYVYGPLIEKAIKDGNLKLDRVAGESDNIKKLAKGRIKAFLANRKIGLDLIKRAVKKGEITQAQADNIVAHPKIVQKGISYHVIFSIKNSKSKEILNKLNEGLVVIKKNGKLDKMLKDAEAGIYDK